MTRCFSAPSRGKQPYWGTVGRSFAPQPAGSFPIFYAPRRPRPLTTIPLLSTPQPAPAADDLGIL